MKKEKSNKNIIDKVKLNDVEFFNQVKINNAGTYLIDNEIVEIDWNNKNYSVKDINNIKKVNSTTYIQYYVNREDENKKLSVDDYSIKQQELLSKSEFYSADDSEEEYRKWNTIEDEFEYKKFIRDWIPVNNSIQEFSEPLKFEIVEHNIKTENPFIENYFLNGGKDFDVYTYNRQSAAMSIVKDKFKQLGMKFIEKGDYKDTNKKLVWSNSTHSGIRYVTAFNTYIFNDNVKKFDYNKTGKYDTLNSLYEQDKKEIENHIQVRYDLHFKEKVNIDYEFVYKTLNRLFSEVSSLNVYKNELSDKRYVLKLINELREHIENNSKK